jgi:hypothetical protein
VINVKIVIERGDKNIFHCTVGNKNPENKPVFKNLPSNLMYDRTFGTKQNLFIITRGFLGDALKQVPALAHTLMKEDQQTSARGETQWPYPMIFRFNHKEYRAVFKFDKMNHIIECPPVQTSGVYITSTDTEVSNTWPLIDKVRSKVNINSIAWYCMRYVLLTTDIFFNIEIVDGEEKYTLRVLPTTTNPISSKWSNAPSIFSYTLEEFKTYLYATHNKNKITVYRRIKDFREWNQVPKKKVLDLSIPIAEFLKDEDIREQKILALYLRLRKEGKITAPPDKLSLPYTVKEDRKDALAYRLAHMQPGLDVSGAAYEIVHAVVREKDSASGQ